MSPILIPVSPGELIDRITILQLRLEHAKQQTQHQAIQYELRALSPLKDALPIEPAQFLPLCQQLGDVNRVLWNAEDEIRSLAQSRADDARLLEVALLICRSNDLRCQLKGQINAIAGAQHAEIKVYSMGNAGH